MRVGGTQEQPVTKHPEAPIVRPQHALISPGHFAEVARSAAPSARIAQASPPHPVTYKTPSITSGSGLEVSSRSGLKCPRRLELADVSGVICVRGLNRCRNNCLN